MQQSVRTPFIPALFFTLLPVAMSAQGVVDFDDLTLTVPPTTASASGGVYYNGSDGVGGFTSRGVFFTNSYNASFGSWSGWAYSNMGDTATAGWGNQYASFAGGGVDGSTFAVGYAGSSLSLELPAAANVESVFLTNGTYAALSMSLGDDFAKKFGGADGSDPDFFLLSMTGKNPAGTVTGAVDFYLADFRAADGASDFIRSDWTQVDLSGLGTGVKTIEFSLSSSDNAAWGMNTPAYFVMDELRFSVIPEPGLFSLAVGLLGLFPALRRRRSLTGFSASR